MSTFLDLARLFAPCLLVACSASSPAATEVFVGPPRSSPPPSQIPAGDGVEEAAGPGSYEIYPGISVPEAWVDCRTEEDCAIVVAGCCDHCNGGAITTVNRAFAERARALLQKKEASAPCGTCAKVACDPPEHHRLVCMTTACHFEDLEEEVEERIWGSGDAAPVEGGNEVGVP